MSVSSRHATKRYDERYFDRWYRDPRHRVITPAALTRRVSWAISAVEYLLDRPLRSVLDVGCGEAHWQSIVRRLRPRATYVGVDPSPYVTARYGGRRNVVTGAIESLDDVGLDGPFDLVVCCAMLNYLPPRIVTRGLRQLRGVLGGLAHIELFSRYDPVEGDMTGWRWYSRAWAGNAIRRAGLVPVGLNCFVTRDRAAELCVLERLP